MDGAALRMYWDVIRELRARRGMTPQQLADASGLSRSQVGQIESGRGNPTIASLRRVAAALGVPVHVLLESEADSDATAIPTNGRVVRAAERTHLHTAGLAGTTIELLSPNLRGLLEATMAVGDGPADDDLRLLTHAGEEFGYVLEGTFEVVIGRERWTLEPGDAITLDPREPHGASRVTPGPGRILWVCTPPSI